MGIHVTIADDHSIFRDGVKSILIKDKRIAAVYEASNGSEIDAIIESNEVHVIIMDIDMGGTNGIDETVRIKSKHPHIHILILSMLGQHEYIMKALECGATGYILKNAGKDELLAAVTSVARGDSYFSHEVSSILISHIKNPINTKHNEGDVLLSPREVEVVKLIAQEFSNAEIAEKLNISIRTVDTHRRNLLEKLQVKNSVGITKYAIKQGLI